MRALAAFLVALWAASPAAAAAEDEAVKLEFKGLRPAGRALRLKLEIETTLPKSTILNLDLMRVREAFSSYHMIPTATNDSGGLLEVESRKFSHEFMVRGPGRYEVEVSFLSQLQGKNVAVPKLKTDHWKITFDAWDDALVSTLGEHLREVDAVVALVADFMARMDAATAKEEDWKAQEEALTKETDQLLTKVDEVPKGLYPAALKELDAALRVIRGGETAFAWKDGKFIGPLVYKGTTILKTNRREEFTFKNFSRYVKEADDIAGREFGLWVIKEVRRSKAPITEALIEQVRACSSHTGVAPFSARLQACAAEDLDALETEIRTLTPPAAETPGVPGEKKEGDGKTPPDGTPPGQKPEDKKQGDTGKNP